MNRPKSCKHLNTVKILFGRKEENLKKQETTESTRTRKYHSDRNWETNLQYNL